MMIIHGEKPYGKCDVVPELFYVATWFMHIDYIPLFPTGTKLVLGKTGNNYQVVNLPFSIKSIFYAWARTGLFFGGIIAWIFVIGSIADRPGPNSTEWVMPVLIAVACTMAFLFIMIVPRRKLPRYERACQLAQLAGLTDRGWAALNVIYGRDITDRPGTPSQFDLPQA